TFSESHRSPHASRLGVLFQLTVRSCRKLQTRGCAHSMDKWRLVFFARNVRPPNVLYEQLPKWENPARGSAMQPALGKLLVTETGGIFMLVSLELYLPSWEVASRQHRTKR